MPAAEQGDTGSGPPPAGRRPRHGGRAWRALGAATLLIVVPALLYVAHVFEHQRRIERRNLRLLDHAATRVEKVLENMGTNVESLTRIWPTDEDGIDEATRQWVEQRDQEFVEKFVQEFVDEFERRQPYLEFHERADRGELIKRLKGLVLEIETNEKRASAGSVGQTTRDSLEPTLTADPDESGHRHLHLVIPQDESKELKKIDFEVHLNQILSDLPLSDPPHPFDHLLVADHDGHVVLQDSIRTFETGRSSLRLESLQAVLERSRPAVPASGAIEPQAGGQSSAGQEEPEGYAAALQATLHRKVELGDEDLHLLCQPFAVPGLADEAPAKPAAGGETQGGGRSAAQEEAHAGSTWTICGLVASDRIVRESLAVAPQLAVALLLLIVYVALAWPFLKLALMDRRERFSLPDAYLLLFSTGACLLLTTILLADADGYLGLVREAEGRLEATAVDVEKRLEQVTRGLHSQLCVYESALCAESENWDRNHAETHLLTAAEHRSSTEEDRLSLPPGETDFTSVYWMDGDGKQFAKATVYGANTPWVDLSKRSYFSEVAEDRLGNRPFFFETFLSITTGEREVALSTRSCLESRVLEDRDISAGSTVPAVAAINASPFALTHWVLDPGLSFAVVDEAGTALFHSDSKRALDQNLFDEVDRSRRLRSAMRSLTPVHFGSYYETRPHLLFVRPLKLPEERSWLQEDEHWWVVALYDLEVLRTMNLEAVGRMLVMALPYLLLINLPFILFGMIVGHARWCWPDPRKHGLYLGLSLCYAALAMVLLWVLLTADWDRILAASLAVPALAAALTMGAFGWRDYRDRRRSRKSNGEKPSPDNVAPGNGGGDPESGGAGSSEERCRPRYCTASVLLWLVLAVLPGLGFFTVGWDRQREVAAAYQMRHRQQEAAAREREVAERNRQVGGSLAGKVEEEPAAPGQAATTPGGTVRWPQPLHSRLMWELARYLPIYNPTVEATRYLAPDGEGDRASGSSGAPLWLLWLPWLTLAAAGTPALFLWVRWVARNVFFFDGLGAKRELDFEGLKKRLKDSRRSIVAHIADPQDRRELFAEGAFDVVRFDGEHLRAGLAEPAFGPRKRRPVVCAYFESDIADPEVRRAKLRLLERLVYNQRRKIVLPLSWNPFEAFFSQRPRDEDAPPVGEAAPAADAAARLEPMTAASVSAVRMDPEEAGRWGRLLSEFEVYPVVVGRAEKRAKTAEEFERVKVGRRAEEKAEMGSDEGYCWALWNACSADERLVLVHLVRESFVNPKQKRVVHGLLRRGLLAKRPNLEPMDDALRDLVARIYPSSEITRWERQIQGLGWERLRWAFVSLVLVVGLFLFATQPGLFNATITYVSAFTVGVLPILFRVLGGITRGAPHQP